jgi:hypothetical protein
LRPTAIPEAAELGSFVRTTWIAAAERAGVPAEQVLASPAPRDGCSPTRTSLAHVAAFLTSDLSAGMTATHHQPDQVAG